MSMRNGKVYRLEEGVPGITRIRHAEFHQACDRWLHARGLVTAPNFRSSDFLFDNAKRRKAKR